MRTAGLVLVCLAAALAGPFIRAEPAPAAPLSCPQVASVVLPGGAERLACLDDPALRTCPDLVPGERYSGCTPLGPVRGPVLAMRGQPIDVNRAIEEDLRALPGVGAGLAQRLVEGRSERPYCAPEELSRVRGIGAKRSRALAPHLTFGHPLCGRPHAE